YFTFSFSPLRDDDGRIAGILQIVTEVTAAVLAERRASLLHALSNQTARAKTSDDAARLAAQVLATAAEDFPFTLLYLVDPVDDHRFALAGTSGLAEGAAPFPPAIDVRVDLRGEAAGLAAELARAVRERAPVSIASPGPAVASPIAAADQHSIVA